MSFLSPWFLAGLLGIGIPIAIHLIRREKTVKIPFSTVRFLRKVPRQFLTHRFRQWMLLSMRVCIVALLAFAFARPWITQNAFGQKAFGWVGPSHESAVILIDRSMSMGYGDYFRRAKDKAAEISGRLSEAAIVSFSEGVDGVKELTMDRSERQSFLDALDSPGYDSTQYLPALRLADQILETAHFPNKTVYLISDFQHHAFEARNRRFRFRPGVRFESIPIADKETTNLAVTHVKAPQRLIREREDHIIRARVQNFGTRPASETRVTLAIDGKTAAAKRVDLTGRSEIAAGAGTAVEVEFPVTFKDRGMHLGVISVGEDPLSADNHYYFAVNVLPPVKVLCIAPAAAGNGYEDDGYWFRLALENSDSSFEIATASPEQLDPAQVDAYDAIFLLNVGKLEQARADALNAYVQKGGNLMLAPADRVDGETFNRLFAELSPAVLEPKPVRTDRNFLKVTGYRDRHPIFRPIGTIDLTSTRIRGYWPVTPAEDSRVLMELENGAPVLLEKEIGAGRVMLFTSSLDTKWNNFPLQPLYLPFLHEALGYLARRENKKSAYRIGESIPIDVSAGMQAAVTAHMIDPRGNKVLIPSEDGPVHYFTGTRMPGFYTVRSGRDKEQVAVNTPVSESNLAPMDPASVRAWVIDSDPKPVHAAEAQSAAMKAQAEKSQRLWWWLLLMVFILALGETLVANRTYR
jgi:hypothetical protein